MGTAGPGTALLRRPALGDQAVAGSWDTPWGRVASVVTTTPEGGRGATAALLLVWTSPFARYFYLAERGQVVRVQPQVAGRQPAVDLGGAAGPDDRPGDPVGGQGPGHGHGGHRDPVPLGQRLQPPGQLEVGGQLGRAEVVVVAAPVALGQVADPLGVEAAGEQARAERAVADDPGAVGRRPGDQLGRGRPVEQAVGRLQGVDVADPLTALQQPHVEVADPGPADLALGDQLGHGPPGLLDRRARGGVRPVELVEVDVVGAEALEALLQLEPDRLRPQVVGGLVVLAAVPGPAALGEHQLPAGALAQHLPDDLLGVPEPVHGGRVDPGHAGVEGLVEGGDRLVVVLRAPAEPPRPADRPGAHADHRELGPVPAQPAELHCAYPTFRSQPPGLKLNRNFSRERSTSKSSRSLRKSCTASAGPGPKASYTGWPLTLVSSTTR